MFTSFATQWAVAGQAPLFMGFPRQKYQSGLPFPSPGDLPNPEIEPVSPALGDVFLTTELLGKLCFKPSHLLKASFQRPFSWGLGLHYIDLGRTHSV